MDCDVRFQDNNFHLVKTDIIPSTADPLGRVQSALLVVRAFVKPVPVDYATSERIDWLPLELFHDIDLKSPNDNRKAKNLIRTLKENWRRRNQYGRKQKVTVKVMIILRIEMRGQRETKKYSLSSLN
jgi:hypothetical protein